MMSSLNSDFCVFFPCCLSTVVIYLNLLVVLLKVRQSTRVKTMISQYITTPLINEQEKLQQKKIKESLFQLVIFSDDSVGCLKKKEIVSSSSSPSRHVPFAIRSISLCS